MFPGQGLECSYHLGARLLLTHGLIPGLAIHPGPLRGTEARTQTHSGVPLCVCVSWGYLATQFLCKWCLWVFSFVIDFSLDLLIVTCRFRGTNIFCCHFCHLPRIWSAYISSERYDPKLLFFKKVPTPPSVKSPWAAASASTPQRPSSGQPRGSLS